MTTETAPTSATTGGAVEHATFDIQGMTCAACSTRIQRTLTRTDGVRDASVNLMTNTAAVDFDPSHLTTDRLLEIIHDTGYGATLPEPDIDLETELAEQEKRTVAEERDLLWKAGYSIAVGIVTMALGMAPWTRWAGLGLALPVVLWAGRHFYTRAWAAAKHGAADMNTLVAVGTAAAMMLSVAMTLFAREVEARGAEPHVYYEAVGFIVGFVLVGHLLEARAKHRTSESIRRLIGLRPDSARKLDGDIETIIPIADVRVGDVLRIKPGDRIPVDAMVIDGDSRVDEAMLTGEPVPVHKQQGDVVHAGTVNTHGILRVRVQRIGRDTALARIIQLVRNAQASRAPIQQYADRVAAVFVPFVGAIALVTFGAWLLFGAPPSWLHAIVSAVSVLVIACPCAMGLAVPTAVMVASGRAAEQGMLVGGGETLQRLQDVDTIVLDKTGTLTVGAPEVREVVRFDAEDPLLLAASLERESEHPLGRAIVADATNRGLVIAPASTVRNVAGRGMIGTVAGRAVLVGNSTWMTDNAVEISGAVVDAERLGASGLTAVHVALDGRVIGVIGVGDAARVEAAEAVRALRSAGIDLIMLTGDSAPSAAAIGRIVGIDRIIADATPASKLALIKQLKEQGHVVAMVGDGINDAPALAAADVGVAIGTGTDVAIDAAGLTLMRADLRDLPKAIELSRRTLRIIRQNLVWAFGYNVVCIPVAAGVLYPVFGWQLSPGLAAGAMALSSVSVVMNSLRLRKG